MELTRKGDSPAVMISTKDFDNACSLALEEMRDDPKLDGMAACIIPIAGMIFAEKVKAHLFKGDDATGDDDVVSDDENTKEEI